MDDGRQHFTRSLNVLQYVHICTFGPFSPIWIDDPQEGRSNVISQVLLGVWDRFHEHGIEIPFPQRDLHMKSSDVRLAVAGVKQIG